MEESRILKPESQQRKLGWSEFLTWPNLPNWLRVALIFVAFVLTTEIATNTQFNSHPDEYLHYDAFRYFESNWWTPDLGSDEIVYSRWGWSRLFTGDPVYFIYGKLGLLLKTILLPGANLNPEILAVLPYRLLNIALFMSTLCVLLFYKTKRFNPSFIAVTLLVIPQIYYIYSYANSDAWGLSLSIFLFLIAWKMVEKPSTDWSMFEFGLLAVLTGLLLTAKLNFRLSLILPYFLLMIHFFREKINLKDFNIKWFLVRLLYLGVIVLLIYAPFNIIYMNSQGDYRAQRKLMVEEKARDGYKPSEKRSLGGQGETYLVVVTTRPFFQWTIKSFIGVFGYFSVWLPRLIYISFFSLLIISICITGLALNISWSLMDRIETIAILISPFIILINLFASLYNSLWDTFQPQGRYLFASIVPIAIILMGTIFVEENKLRKFRMISVGIMYLLCIISLVFVLHFGTALKI